MSSGGLSVLVTYVAVWLHDAVVTVSHMLFQTLVSLAKHSPRPASRVCQLPHEPNVPRVNLWLFFYRGAAEADLRDAAASYGKHHANTPELPGHALVQQHQAATAALAAASKLATGGLPAGVTLKHAETVGDRKSVFITQRATAGVDAAGPGHHHSPASGYSTSRSNQGRSSSPVRGGSPHRLTIGAAAAVSGGAEGSKSSRSRR